LTPNVNVLIAACCSNHRGHMDVRASLLPRSPFTLLFV
jgi:hypothetical protein